MTTEPNKSASSSVSDDAIKKLLDRSLDALNEADERADQEGGEKTVSYFGLIKLPESVATVVSGLWNEVARGFGNWIEHNTYDHVSKFGQSIGLKGTALNRTVALTYAGINIGIRGSTQFSRMFEGLKEQYGEHTKLTQRLAPVLDELKGGHSVGALMSVRVQENEMIYAHRQRLVLKARTRGFNDFLDLLINVGTSMSLDYDTFAANWKGTREPKKEAKAAESWLERIINIGASPVSTYITRSNDRTLKRRLDKNSALEMVLKLEEQLQKDPKASMFSLPDGSGSYSLEEYIAQTMVQHQHDMSRINPEYTLLRKALHDDLAKLVEPVAEALRKGDLAPISLVRWIGEGKLIQEKGRKLATPGEITALLGTAERAPQPSLTIDPKTYYADASFSKADLKLALQSMEGQERLVFASMFPDTVLQQAGVSEEEVKSIRAQSLKAYEHTLAQILSGIAAKTDEDLEKEGLAKNEIKQLRDAITALQEKGEDAIRDVKSTHVNTNGLERVLTNLAVPRVKGDKTYFGRIIASGKEKLSTLLTESKPSANISADAKDSHAAAVRDNGVGELTEQPAR